MIAKSCCFLSKYLEKAFRALINAKKCFEIMGKKVFLMGCWAYSIPPPPMKIQGNYVMDRPTVFYILLCVLCLIDTFYICF